LLRSESFDADPLAEVAPRLDERRDAAALCDAPPRDFAVPDDRPEPDDRLEPDDRPEPDDRLEPDDRPEPDAPLEPEDFERVDLLAAPLAVRLARPAPLDAAFVDPLPPLDAAFVDPLPPLDAAFVDPPLRLGATLAEPPLPLLALLPVVFRPVCFRELLVVATSPPFPGLTKRYPLVGVR
jgi:hypothetical protein